MSPLTLGISFSYRYPNPLKYQSTEEFKSLCEDLLKWGNRGHEYLEVVSVKKGFRSYYTLKTGSSWFRGITKLERCSVLVQLLFQLNKSKFLTLDGDLPANLVNELRVRFKNEPIFSYFYDNLHKQVQSNTYARLGVWLKNADNYQTQTMRLLEEVRSVRINALAKSLVCELIEIETLANKEYSKELSDFCKRSFHVWKQAKVYPQIFVEVLSSISVPPQSEIYQTIPKLKDLQNVESIRDDNFVCIFYSKTLTVQQQFKWLFEMSPKETYVEQNSKTRRDYTIN